MADARATLARWHALLRTDASHAAPQHADLLAALRALEPGARDALLLSTLDELSVARIAGLLDESAGTIAYWISSARRQLASVATNLRDELVAIEAAAPESPLSAPRSRISPIVWLGVPLTMVLVLAMIGAAQLTRRQSLVDVGGNASATPTGSVPMVSDIDWRDVRFVKDGTIHQLGLVGERVVAVGHLRGSPADAWFSDDGGETWGPGSMAATQPSESSTVAFQGVAATESSVVAYGEWQIPDQPPTGEPRWTSWASADRGATWTQSETSQSGLITGMVARGDEFLATGIDVGRGSILLWRSSDGLRWEEVAPRGFPQFAVHVNAMTVFDGALFAAGVNTRGSRPRIGVWSSADGQTWKAVEGAPVDSGEMTSITSGPSGVLAAGFTGSRPDGTDARPMLWTSSDGITWSAMELGDRPMRPISMASGPLGTTVLGMGMQGGSLRVWFVSTDMTSVTAQDFGGSVGIVALPDHFVSAGGCADAACTRSKVVVGEPVTATPDS